VPTGGPQGPTRGEVGAAPIGEEQRKAVRLPLRGLCESVTLPTLSFARVERTTVELGVRLNQLRVRAIPVASSLVRSLPGTDPS